MYILIDIGGTSTRIATTSDLKSIGKVEVLSTNQNYEKAIDEICNTVKNLSSDSKVLEVVVGVPGPLNTDKSNLLNAPNLTDYIHKPLKSDLSLALESPVTLYNDSDLVALGESVFGAGKGHRIVAYLTISTGIGGSRIVNGKIDNFTVGFEPGHQIIDLHNSLEILAGGASLTKKYDTPPDELTDRSVWDLEEEYIAIGVHNTICYWSPDVVILGGSVMKKVSVVRVSEKVRKSLTIFPVLPEIVGSELGDLGGLWGGVATLAKQDSY